MSQTIFHILKTDAKYRYEGVTDDVYFLNDLKVDTDWKFDVPTLAKYNVSEYKTRKYTTNINEFKDKFYKKYRVLKNVDMTNLLVAGGAIRSVLLDQHTNDIDIFVYGINDPYTATRRIERFISEMQHHMNKIKTGVYLEEELARYNLTDDTNKTKYQQEKDKEMMDKIKKDKTITDKNMETKIVAMYNGNTITLMLDNIKMQLILRLYHTASEIIHGFDLGSSAVGFDGENVLFTTLSKFCYENMVNIFDGTRRSTTYEFRLVKYFDHGFNIVLPNLDIKKLKTSYFKYQLKEVCEMPHIVFSYKNIDGNVIYVDKFYNTNNSSEIKSDYDFYDEYDSKYKIPYFNLTELISGRRKFILMKKIKVDEITPSSHNIEKEIVDQEKDEENEDDEDNENDEDNISTKTNMDSEFDDNVSNDINNNLLSFNETVLRYGFVEWCYNMVFSNLMKKNVNFDNIFKYFNVVDPKKLVQDVYLSDLTREQRENMLRDIILKQKQWVKEQLEKLSQDSKLNWMTENPTTQLTSSFNPIIEDPKLWYGEYYKA